MKRLMLFAAGIFFLLNTNAQKNRLKKERLAERNRQIEKCVVKNIRVATL